MLPLSRLGSVQVTPVRLCDAGHAYVDRSCINCPSPFRSHCKTPVSNRAKPAGANKQSTCKSVKQHTKQQAAFSDCPCSVEPNQGQNLIHSMIHSTGFFWIQAPNCGPGETWEEDGTLQKSKRKIPMPNCKC